jgi:hypothetical protein
MVNKKVTMRDYYRGFITRANKEAGVTYNASKLNSIKECEDHLLNLIKNLRHNKQDNKAYIKEINELKEKIEILNAGNKRLESERTFYITQAKEAGEKREYAEKEKEYYRNHAKYWNDSYYQKDNEVKTLKNFSAFLGLATIIEAISITLLIWK